MVQIKRKQAPAATNCGLPTNPADETRGTLCEGCERVRCTSLMTMRPAMRRRVKGGKCEVMRRRRLASENESWWGCMFSISSTITTPVSWPATTDESGDGGERQREVSTRYMWEGVDSFKR